MSDHNSKHYGHYGLLGITAVAGVLSLAFVGWRTAQAFDDGRSIRSSQPGSSGDGSSASEDTENTSVSASQTAPAGPDTAPSGAVALDDPPESPTRSQLNIAGEALSQHLARLVEQGKQPDRETMIAMEWLVDHLHTQAEPDSDAVETVPLDYPYYDALVGANFAVVVAADMLLGLSRPVGELDNETVERAKRIVRAGLSHNLSRVRSSAVAGLGQGDVERYPEFVSKIRTMRETDPVDNVAYIANRIRLPGDDW